MRSCYSVLYSQRLISSSRQIAMKPKLPGKSPEVLRPAEYNDPENSSSILSEKNCIEVFNQKTANPTLPRCHPPPPVVNVKADVQEEPRGLTVSQIGVGGYLSPRHPHGGTSLASYTCASLSPTLNGLRSTDKSILGHQADCFQSQGMLLELRILLNGWVGVGGGTLYFFPS